MTWRDEVSVLGAAEVARTSCAEVAGLVVRGVVRARVRGGGVPTLDTVWVCRSDVVAWYEARVARGVPDQLEAARVVRRRYASGVWPPGAGGSDVSARERRGVVMAWLVRQPAGPVRVSAVRGALAGRRWVSARVVWEVVGELVAGGVVRVWRGDDRRSWWVEVLVNTDGPTG